MGCGDAAWILLRPGPRLPAQAGREPLSSAPCQPAAADPGRCFQARRRPGHLCGLTTCPQPSALASCSIWTRYPHQVFHNAFTHPQGPCCVMKTKQSPIRKKKKKKSWGGKEQAGHTHTSFLPGLHPKDGSLAARVRVLSHVLPPSENNDSVKVRT